MTAPNPQYHADRPRTPNPQYHADQPRNPYPVQHAEHPRKPGRFDNANWFARGGMVLSLLSFPLANLFGMTGLIVAIACVFIGFALGVYALVSKNAPNTERWCAWMAVGIFALNIVAGVIVFVVEAS